MAIAYEQLGDDTISAIPVAKIQTDGYLFMWVINAKYRLAIEMISYWGYTWARRREVRRRFVDEIAWVKCNRNRRMAKRGNPPPLTNFGLESDVIYSERLGQSQKPTDIYELIERLVPNGGRCAAR